MIIYALIALLAGILISNQTPINTDLKNYSGTPLSAGLLSFFVGSIFLALVTFLTTGRLLPGPDFIASQPAWIWLGGFLGAIYLTSNIFLFPKLGALQTVILPIVGQIVMGTMIDSFGLFGARKIPFSLLHSLAILLLFAGLVVAVVLPTFLVKKEKASVQRSGKLIGWQVWGIIIGGLGAMQQAINGRLGVLLANTPQATFISFLTGVILIFIVVMIVDKKLPRLSNLSQAKPWNFLGGILGALFVFATVVAVPKIGTGLSIMMGLIGQIIGGMLVQQFGLWKSKKNPVQFLQVLGAVIMVIAVVLIKIL
ncbi:DMT family transporter [Lactococcus termiticola]|uniref:Membrane protein n=1 Tax=Lactococcus termiticola TaxID=2169526 RepID=A0A2R5HDS6_9LACT|nr:DMT family transporter [Lactococcus termiticola]GBG96213.1 membrane protein [Lactococcus termiticola]